MSKIMEILQKLQVIGGLIPVVLALVNQFEVPGFGAEKKKVVLEAVGKFYDSLEITIFTREKVLGIAGGFIDVAVAFYNIVGWFKKANPTPNT